MPDHSTDDADLARIYHQEMMRFIHDAVHFISDISALERHVTLKNPLCGDWVSIGYNAQRDLKWHGEGCLLCRASSEAICQISAACDQDFLVHKCNDILAFYNQDQNYLPHYLPHKFMCFESIKQLKARINCVTLSVKAAIELHQIQGV